MALNAPIYDIGSTVYLRESAAIGFVEGYKVQSVRYSVSGSVIYKLAFYAKSPNAAATIGDRITGLHVMPVEMRETDLITYCEALDLAIANLEEQLTSLNRLKSSSDCSGTS